MARQSLPDVMTAVVLNAYSGADGLRVEERPLPRPGKNEVLVKVAASPINPSDLALLAGQYGFNNHPPLVPGGEGSGTVVAVGPGGMARFFRDKRVACLNQGSADGLWAEYVVAPARGGVLPLATSVTLEQGATSFINPMTACAFLAIATKDDHRSVVLTAAASSLGQMINRLFRAEGLHVINVVRRDAQVKLLTEQGATTVLNSSDDDFENELHAATRQNDTRLAFDAVAGPMTRQLLDALPHNSTVTVFSCLSRQAPEIGHDHLIFQGKTVRGFWLGPWISSMNPIRILMLWRRAQELLGEELRSTIRARYPLDEARTAVEDYSSQMTGGKILLTPGL